MDVNWMRNNNGFDDASWVHCHFYVASSLNQEGDTVYSNVAVVNLLKIYNNLCVIAIAIHYLA